MSLFTSTAPPQWRAAVALDTLAAAWGLTPAEIATLAGVSAETIDGWRRSEELGWSEAANARATALVRLHELLWISVPYIQWPVWWRRRWRHDSSLGARSPLEAALSDKAAALQTLAGHLAALAQPSFL